MGGGFSSLHALCDRVVSCGARGSGSIQASGYRKILRYRLVDDRLVVMDWLFNFRILIALQYGFIMIDRTRVWVLYDTTFYWGGIWLLYYDVGPSS